MWKIISDSRAEDDDDEEDEMLFQTFNVEKNIGMDIDIDSPSQKRNGRGKSSGKAIEKRICENKALRDHFNKGLYSLVELESLSSTMLHSRTSIEELVWKKSQCIENGEHVEEDEILADTLTKRAVYITGGLWSYATKKNSNVLVQLDHLQTIQQDLLNN
ncbi:hypothetical protein M9H77_27485 [Catharanthus roseus]|uniref:Uncharacterized protein n=1 Tax=Catharanthus roseus TaxID=4058 RepID=A0ACC0ACL4_CATRO|nr:hypothetical protein M9H77_27485 [Catharanthus roseus]